MKSAALWLALLAPWFTACSGPPPPPADIPECPAAISAPVPVGTWDAGTVAVPMGIEQTSADGTYRFTLPLGVGDAEPIDVFFDTGSSGLRILEGAVPDSAFTCVTKTEVTYAYHSGLGLAGWLAYATVSLGSVSTAAPIPVMLVTQIGCDSANPACGAEGATPEDFSLFGPFKAVFGVGLRTGDHQIGSALAQLAGAPSFAVLSPDDGGDGGTLLVGPVALLSPGFDLFQLPAVDGGAVLPNGLAAWDDRYGLPACLADQTSGVSYCLPAELDTGNPPTYVEWPGDTDDSVTVLAPGSQIEVTLGPDGGLGRYGFTIGATPTPGIDEVEIEPASGPGFMNLGTAVFFRFDVLFGPASGRIGLKPHP